MTRNPAKCRSRSAATLSLLAVACSRPAPAPKLLPPPPPTSPCPATFRRMVAELIGRRLEVADVTRLPCCVAPLMATAEGRAELAALGETTPYAAWHAASGTFVYGYVAIFADAPPGIAIVTDEGRRTVGVMLGASRWTRLVSLRFDAGRLVVRVERDPSAEQRVYVRFDGRGGVLEPGRQYDLVMQAPAEAAGDCLHPVELLQVD